MTRQEILEKAVEEYPIGTEYEIIDSNGRPYPKKYNVTRRPNYMTENINDPDYNNIDAGIGYIYANGKWAHNSNRELDLARKIIYKD